MQLTVVQKVLKIDRCIFGIVTLKVIESGYLASSMTRTDCFLFCNRSLIEMKVVIPTWLTVDDKTVYWVSSDSKTYCTSEASSHGTPAFLMHEEHKCYGISTWDQHVFVVWHRKRGR